MQALGQDELERASAASDSSLDKDKTRSSDVREDTKITAGGAIDTDADGDHEGVNGNDHMEEDEEEEEEQQDSQTSIGDANNKVKTQDAPSQETSLSYAPTHAEPNSIIVNGSGPTSAPSQGLLPSSPSPTQDSSASAGLPYDIPKVRPEVLTAPVYDVVPTIAAPHSTSINAIAATPDLRWVFSGGADGYIRKFNWIETVNGKSMLTVAQRHPFVDSVTKAGVLLNYWENNEDASGQSKISYIRPVPFECY